MEVVVKTLFGSHLYGTDVEGSDFDYKIIYKDSVDDIILSKNGTVKRTGSGTDVEAEYIELRKFIKDLANGQTYAVDMIFTPKEHILEKSAIWDHLREHRQKFMTKQVKSFIRYCTQQAKIYSLKGEKINKAKRLLEITGPLDPHSKLIDATDLLVAEVPMITKSVTKNGRNLGEDFFELLGKYYPTNLTVKEFRDRLQEILNRYGVRAHEASINSEKDWKAIYHAFRVVRELSELARTGQIKFPLATRDELVEIRKGVWRDYRPERLEWELKSAIADVRASSHLASEIDQDWLDQFVLEFYKWPSTALKTCFM